MDLLFLAGKHKSLAAFFLRALDQSPDGHPRKPAPAVRRQRIDAENHLPGTIFVVHLCILIHFISEVRLVGHKTIGEADQSAAEKYQPEMISIGAYALCKFLPRCGLCRRKT